MIGDLYNADNVVVGQAAVFFADGDTALPAVTAFNTADPFDATYMTGFQAVGATDQGWQFGANKNTQTINIEEQSTPVATTITSQSVTISGSLAEDISRTLALALNTTKATPAASASTPGYDLHSLSDDPIEYAVAMVMQNAEGFGRLIYAPRWVQLSNAQVSFRRASDKRMYAVQFETVCNTSDIQVYEFTAAKTA
jgi:hypothetical protein